MSKQILVIDDEELLTRSYSKLLEKQGYSVYTVKNGSDAVAMSEEEDFDLIISDVRMPGETGVKTIQKIQAGLKKRKHISVPVIFVTGYADEKLEAEAKKLNPLAYLFKPFDVPKFLDLIKSSLR